MQLTDVHAVFLRASQGIAPARCFEPINNGMKDQRVEVGPNKLRARDADTPAWSLWGVGPRWVCEELETRNTTAKFSGVISPFSMSKRKPRHPTASSLVRADDSIEIPIAVR